MSVAEVAHGLVELCQQGKSLEAIDKYYGQDIVSIEASDCGHTPQVVEGFDAVRAKTEWFYNHMEVHGGDMKGPYVGKDGFTIWWSIDVTDTMSGQRMQMEEIAVYTVEGGKIVREQFYYNMPSE